MNKEKVRRGHANCFHKEAEDNIPVCHFNKFCRSFKFKSRENNYPLKTNDDEECMSNNSHVGH